MKIQKSIEYIVKCNINRGDEKEEYITYFCLNRNAKGKKTLWYGDIKNERLFDRELNY